MRTKSKNAGYYGLSADSAASAKPPGKQTRVGLLVTVPEGGKVVVLETLDEAAALAAIDRCRAIKWQADKSHLGSQVALMEEYLRRSAITAEVLRTTMNWPWWDYGGRFARLVNRKSSLPCYVFSEEEVRYEGPGADPLEDKVIALNQGMNEGSGRQGWHGRKVCWWYIRWASIKTLPSVVSLELPDPYEPMIIFYERGGEFHPEQGIIDLYGAKVIQGGWQRRAEQAPLLSLDPAALDLLDTLGPYGSVKAKQP